MIFAIKDQKAWQILEQIQEIEDRVQKPINWDAPELLRLCHRKETLHQQLAMRDRIKAAIRKRGCFAQELNHFTETHSLEHIINVFKEADA